MENDSGDRFVRTRGEGMAAKEIRGFQINTHRFHFCLDDPIVVFEPEVEPVPVGCEIIDCCPGCPGPPWTMEWEVTIVDPEAVGFELIPINLLTPLEQLKLTGFELVKGRFRLTAKRGLISGIRYEELGRAGGFKPVPFFRARPRAGVYKVDIEQRLAGAAIVVRKDLLRYVFRRCRVRTLHKCVKICVKTIEGASPDVDHDIATANEIYAQCGIEIVRIEVETNDVPELLDLDQPQCSSGMAISDEQDQLFDLMREECPADIIAYYVRSTSLGVRGCAAFPAGRPGVVVTDSATQFTLAHELGHVLGLSHINDTTNLMNPNTGQITVDTPILTDEQCETINESEFIDTCVHWVAP